MQSAKELARQLALDAEQVCRRYLPNGRREGRYWIVGDVRNTPGRSMFVRIQGRDEGRGAAGRWTDAATGEHGDLLDMIRESCGLTDFKDVLEEARSFLNLSHPGPEIGSSRSRSPAKALTSQESARRLFAMSQPIVDTLVEDYLRKRAISNLHGVACLRFHPNCYYRPHKRARRLAWPAMIASVTDLAGQITGVHRTWLDPDLGVKARFQTPRRAMGELLGHAVRFGTADDVMAVGEGIETVLSLRCIAPALPVAAALSAAHLAAIRFPDTLRRLYVARDSDPAGDRACDVLIERSRAEGIEAIPLSASLQDFNDDLRCLGIDILRANVRVQFAPQDIPRFMSAGV